MFKETICCLCQIDGFKNVCGHLLVIYHTKIGYIISVYGFSEAVGLQCYFVS